LGAGNRKPQRPHIKIFLDVKKYLFLRRVRPLSRLIQVKNSSNGETQNLSRATLTELAKRQILGGGKICPFLLMSRERTSLYFA